MNEDAESSILLELLQNAEEATEPPPPPERGIPKQWVPRFFATMIKGSLLPFVWLDHIMQWIAKKIIRPPFKKRGHCLKRGNCCHCVLIEKSEKWGGKLFYFWYTQIHGFYPRLKRTHLYKGKSMHVMGCRYLKKDGSCGQYPFRPSICRKWPMIEQFDHPRILKGCGFYAEPKSDISNPSDFFIEK